MVVTAFTCPLAIEEMSAAQHATPKVANFMRDYSLFFMFLSSGFPSAP